MYEFNNGEKIIKLSISYILVMSEFSHEQADHAAIFSFMKKFLRGLYVDDGTTVIVFPEQWLNTVAKAIFE